MATSNQFKVRPFLSPIDLSDVKIGDLSGNYEELKDYLQEKDGTLMGVPEKDALWFYMMNHAMAEITLAVDPKAPLGEFEDLMHEYHQTMMVKSLRMIFYLLIITTREARHLAMTQNNPSILETLKSEVSKEAVKFIKKMSGNSAGTVVHELTENPPNCTLGVFVTVLEIIFNECYWSSSYGGEKWGDVTLPLRQFVHGEISAEMVMDTAFTLAHNNGPIFNKGYLFDHYDSGNLTSILDVQRSGQIPQMVLENVQGHITVEMREWHDRVRKLLPDGAFGEDYVDWYLVEALGAINNYTHNKALQKNKYGLPESQKKAEELKEKEAAEATAEMKKLQAKQAAEKEKFIKEHFEVMPGVFVKKSKRMAA